MTAKRFTIKEIDNFSYGIKVTDVIMDSNIELAQSTACDLLNELAYENEQLKQENKQLKHWNKCLAEKRHQEMSYSPYTASKSDKELQEFLEQKVFNCSDR